MVHPNFHSKGGENQHFQPIMCQNTARKSTFIIVNSNSSVYWVPTVTILSLLPTTTLLAMTPIFKMRKLGLSKVRKLVVTLLGLSNSRGYWLPNYTMQPATVQSGRKSQEICYQQNHLGRSKNCNSAKVSVPCRH